MKEITSNEVILQVHLMHAVSARFTRGEIAQSNIELAQTHPLSSISYQTNGPVENVHYDEDAITIFAALRNMRPLE